MGMRLKASKKGPPNWDTPNARAFSGSTFADICVPSNGQDIFESQLYIFFGEHSDVCICRSRFQVLVAGERPLSSLWKHDLRQLAAIFFSAWPE